MKWGEVETLLGQQDLECTIKHTTYRFFTRYKHKGYSITAQMEKEGEWRVLGGVSDSKRLQGS